MTLVWRLALAVVLVMAIAASACARAPRWTTPGVELRRLVACAVGLYAVGALASLTHHSVLAALVAGAGIVVAALTAWLSRGRAGEDPPEDADPPSAMPPPEPDDEPRLDWPSFERAFRAYARRERAPASPGPP